MERIKKASTIKETRILAESEFFTDVDETPTDIFAINVALSGSITGGLKSGLLTLAGESKNFKTMYGLLMVTFALWFVNLVIPALLGACSILFLKFKGTTEIDE